MARYAISDIHGCLRTFKKALRIIEFSKDDTLILLGDYIDRGIDSKGVIQYIIDLIADGYRVIPLRGNHEQFLIESLKPLPPYASGPSSVVGMWMCNGGDKCLDSYGAIYPWEIPIEHGEFIKSLKLIHEEDDYVFVHGGLNFQLDNPIKESSEDCILWERLYRVPGNKRKAGIGNRILVTGHTPTSKDVMIEMANGEDLITIDRGCVFDGSQYGHLAVFNLDTKQFNFIKNIDNIENDRM